MAACSDCLLQYYIMCSRVGNGSDIDPDDLIMGQAGPIHNIHYSYSMDFPLSHHCCENSLLPQVV